MTAAATCWTSGSIRSRTVVATGVMSTEDATAVSRVGEAPDEAVAL